METKNLEFTLPPAPRGLCFDRNDFVKTNFSVDNFLAEHQNVASLETMRDDLGVYLKILRLAMIELINKDYANFVNLSATLIGFDKVIEKIQVPLGQLNGEVLGLKQCLEEAMKEVSLWLNQRHGLQNKKQLLKYYGQTINCLKTLERILNSISSKKKYDQIALASRAAMQYNQLKFSISKCEGIIKQEQKLTFKTLTGKLIETLNDLLFQFWNDNDDENLLKALITLYSLDRVSETEILLRKQAVAPLLLDIINEPSLQRSKNGLQGVYERILELLDTKLKLFLTVLQHSKLTFLSKKYNFLVNCFWCEVESRLEVNLASIFAPGNPQIFYRRYSESMNFIKKLEKYCPDKETIKLLHNTAEFKSFQRRWNLPVYFQIRFQEIAGGFESVLQKNPIVENNDSFILRESNSCWKALQQCWSEGVYIAALAHKFWKLTLQILSRYAGWASEYCKQVNEESPSARYEVTSMNKTLIENSINIYIDTQTLLQRLPSFLLLVEGKVPIDNKDLLRQSVGHTEIVLRNIEKTIRECIVKELFANLNLQLKQANEIPKLYRKTKRVVPTKPSSYLEAASKAVRDFNGDLLKRVDNAFLVDLYGELFDKLTVVYCKYVEDVLTSVQRTEESLRRLKQIREMNTQQSSGAGGGGVTDDDKIRLQLKIDVLAFRTLAESARVHVNNMDKYNTMYNMVADAVKNIDIK